MFYKKVCNYRARLRQANPQQAKHHAEWSPVFLLRALLAWKIRLARRNSNAARITFSVVLFSLLRHVESYRFSSVLFNSFRFLLILVYILRTVILYNHIQQEQEHHQEQQNLFVKFVAYTVL